MSMCGREGEWMSTSAWDCACAEHNRLGVHGDAVGKNPDTKLLRPFITLNRLSK